jgi:Reverse transcriptase (RNA-dependent DNA polymerase)
MSEEHLKAWLELATDSPDGIAARDSTAWEALCTFVRHVYATGEMPVELSWATMILLPKGEGQYRGIGLLEISWKLISKIIDQQIRRHVEFHDTIHGFRAKRGCGTATIEAKLLQQLATIEQAALFKIFLDLRKAYDTLDRPRTLEILALYGLGKNYGEPFEATRGVTQGDIISPTIFNIVSDAVVCYWLSTVLADIEVPISGVGVGGRERSSLFYADDSKVSSRDPAWLQGAIDVLAELFGRVGLKTNTDKTEVMICHPGHIRTRVSDEAYGQQLGFGGLTFRERSCQKVECPTCHVGLAQSSLRRHMQTRHGQDILTWRHPTPRRWDRGSTECSSPKQTVSSDAVQPALCQAVDTWQQLGVGLGPTSNSDTRKTQSTYSTNRHGRSKSVRLVASS